MILFEFEVKKILEEYGIPTEASVTLSKEDLPRFKDAVARIPSPYVVKAQVRGWGRGRAGLVKFADTLEEAERLVNEMMGIEYRGERVRYVLVSHKVKPLREIYLAMMIDGSPNGVLLLASRSGGVDVESKGVHDLLALRVDPQAGLRDYIVRRVSKHLVIDFNEASRILKGMYRAFWDYSLTLLELNPLVETGEGFLAIDRKAIADEDSGNPKLSDIVARHESELTEIQREAKRWGFSIVLLDGDLAVVGNGAGLTMATLDAVSDSGGRPGLFLDLGGGATSERVRNALKLVFKQANVKAVLVNIVGGITRCDEVAHGLVEALRESGRSDVKLVVRLSGFMEEEGMTVLSRAGIPAFARLEDAVNAVVN